MVEIRFQNLTRSFGEVTAVDDVSLTVGGGELFFLLGPSGCGKTTLLRLVAGFLEPDAGTIHFDDRHIDAVPAHQRNTGMVFQNYALWPHLSVQRNVRYGLDVRHRPKDEKTARVREMLRLVRMEGYEDRFPGELSGGQQQRVALARALAVEPDVVLLDEPLSNLDAKLRLEMRGEITRIHRRSRRTAIYVTHDQKEALSMADRIAVMRKGRIVQVGTPEEVYTRPADLFCARFIGNCNAVPGRISGTDARTVHMETPLGVLSAQAGPQPLAGGSPAVLAVRPESLMPAVSGQENVFQATVVSRMYLGEMVQYQLEAAGIELTATVLGSGDWGKSAGEGILLRFEPSDATAYQPQDTEDE